MWGCQAQKKGERAPAAAAPCGSHGCLTDEVESASIKKTKTPKQQRPAELAEPRRGKKRRITPKKEAMLLGRGVVEKKGARERLTNTPPPRRGCPRPQSAARTRLKSTHYSLRHINGGCRCTRSQHNRTSSSSACNIVVCSRKN